MKKNMADPVGACLRSDTCRIKYLNPYSDDSNDTNENRICAGAGRLINPTYPLLFPMIHQRNYCYPNPKNNIPG